MRYDLELVFELCHELGLRAERRDQNEVAVDLGPEATLLALNAEAEFDCRIGFELGDWHFHDQLCCADGHGHFIELDPLSVLSGLADGSVLVCERRVEGKLLEQSLVYRDFVDEFGAMTPGEEVRCRC